VDRIYVAAFAALIAATIGAAPAAAREPRVLVVTETAGFRHASIVDGSAEVQRLGRRSRRFDVVQLDGGVRALTAWRLRRAAAVVFLNTSGELDMPPSRRTALLHFVRRGGGLVATHSATDTFRTTWPSYSRLLGAQFARHGPIVDGRILVEDRRHPATRDLPTSFPMRDEFYEFFSNPRPRVRVLARLADTGGRDLPLVWSRREGTGRVFYDALGHEPATWHDTHHRRLLTGGLLWALGRTVRSTPNSR
jgi:type 1 glutamine amidotransferase